MGKTTIPWTDYTFNPWWGCSKVSPACTHCYAETMAHRFGDWWGDDKPRRLFSDQHWNEPLKWDARARLTGTRPRVFCGSMCDIFEYRPGLHDLTKEQERLYDLIKLTPHLTWLLLTKRPAERDMSVLGEAISLLNVWFGVTAENQTMANARIPLLLGSGATKTFVSIEPMLGPVNPFITGNVVHGLPIDWVICGDESGAIRRQPGLDDVRALRDLCLMQRTAFFFKQWHENGIRIECPELDGRRWMDIPERG